MKNLRLNSKEIRAAIARRSFEDFVLYTMPTYEVNWHHRLLMEHLQLFAEGKIKKLLVFMPPQHGKSELTSRRLPAYILGINPDTKIVGCSYSGTLASSFNRDVKRIISDSSYSEIFPNTSLNKKKTEQGGYLNNADIFEVVGHRGFYKSVGVGGSLTGTPADIGIIDDPVKDAVEAESATYRARAWDWFTQVFLTRLHNDSQIIVTQTRWNVDDLSGRILKIMNDNKDWVVLSLPAIKEGVTIEEDKRGIGEALWPEKHSLERLMEIKHASPRGFHALYQQDPKPFEGGLIYPKFYVIEPQDFENAEGRSIYGNDFGYNDPNALIHCKIDTKNRILYLDEVIYKTGLTPDKLRAEMTAKGLNRRTEIIADSAAKGQIIDLRKYFNIKPCSKGKLSIQYGIEKVSDFTIYITRHSLGTITELETYRWKEDADGNPTSEPIDDYNHAMDAIRYAVTYLLNNEHGNLLAYG